MNRVSAFGHSQARSGSSLTNARTEVAPLVWTDLFKRKVLLDGCFGDFVGPLCGSPLPRVWVGSGFRRDARQRASPKRKSLGSLGGGLPKHYRPIPRRRLRPHWPNCCRGAAAPGVRFSRIPAIDPARMGASAPPRVGLDQQVSVGSDPGAIRVSGDLLKALRSGRRFPTGSGSLRTCPPCGRTPPRRSPGHR